MTPTRIATDFRSATALPAAGMHTPPAAGRCRAWRPWRCASLGWAVVVLALAGGVPLFLCMPPWIDVTLYDVAVRNVLNGGVHYRDVFDTNLPGVVWLMAAVRSTCGWSYEALRAWDLALVGGACLVLGGWTRRAGGSPSSIAWYAAAVALFYPFTSEFNHCQRDPWMLLPAGVAAWLRLTQIRRAGDGTPPVVRRSVVEGFTWGLAVWIKPHVVVPAFVVWALSVVELRRATSARRIRVDLLGLLGGGLIAGGIGTAWLVATGTWPHFWEVFTRWNPEYMATGVWQDFADKVDDLFWNFRPWSLIHLLSLPVAVWDLAVGLRRPRSNPQVTAGQRSLTAARTLLAGLYLGWFVQALMLQKRMDYIHLPETVLAMAVLAAHGWAVGFPFLVWFLVVGGLLTLGDAVPVVQPAVDQLDPKSRFLKFERHPLVDPAVMGLWPRCWREGGSPELWSRLGQMSEVFCQTSWGELDEAARFLRTVRPPLRDRELTCWHDSTHPLYLTLDLKPSTRYMHFGTVFLFRGKVRQVQQEVAGCPQRFVVSDLRRMSPRIADAYAPGATGPLSLPAWFPRSQRNKFPWDQPIVFRSGRYLVHQVDHPPTADAVVIPDRSRLNAPGTDE